MSYRFSYVKYDATSMADQEKFKTMFEAIEAFAHGVLPDSREKALLLTHLEVSYMWAGKAIRDAQIMRGAQPQHVPERTNG